MGAGAWVAAGGRAGGWRDSAAGCCLCSTMLPAGPPSSIVELLLRCRLPIPPSPCPERCQATTCPRWPAGVPQEASCMAVVVQRQLAPDLCFVLHTRHPGGATC